MASVTSVTILRQTYNTVTGGSFRPPGVAVSGQRLQFGQLFNRPSLGTLTSGELVVERAGVERLYVVHHVSLTDINREPLGESDSIDRFLS